MKKYRIILWLIAICLQHAYAQKQDTLVISLPEAIEMACRHSPEAITARQAYRAAYANWRSFRASQLPSLLFTTSPALNRSISPVTLPDGSDSFVHRNQLATNAGLTINQNIPFTGGSLFISSAIERLDIFTDKLTSYKSTPVIIGYQQDLFGFNTFKWNRKIEPIRFEEAKKTLTETLELVAARTTYYFFQLATAQTNWEIARYNHANADTLYRFAQGRYNIGTITENEMLQLELNLLSEQTNQMNTQIEVDDYNQLLRSYLGIIDNIRLIVQTDMPIPQFIVPEQQAMMLAYQNNPEPETMRRRLLESESAVAQAKAARGFKADLYMQFGFTQTGQQLKDTYRDPMDQQLVSVGIRIPILDWGVGKEKVKVAASNRDKVYTEVEQARTDFEMNILKMVKQFNLQYDKVVIARKTDLTAQRRNDVAQKLYLLGKSDILDLNASITEKDRAKRAHITALYNYWNLYYAIRSLTGFDFEKQTVLTDNYK